MCIYNYIYFYIYNLKMDTLIMIYQGFPKCDKNNKLINHSDTVNEYILNYFDKNYNNILSDQLNINNISIKDFLKVSFEQIKIYESYQFVIDSSPEFIKVKEEFYMINNDLYVCYDQSINNVFKTIIYSIFKLQKNMQITNQFKFINTKKEYIPYINSFYYEYGSGNIAYYYEYFKLRLVMDAHPDIQDAIMLNSDIPFFFIDVNVNKYNEDIINKLIKEKKYDEIYKNLINDPNRMFKFINFYTIKN